MMKIQNVSFKGIYDFRYSKRVDEKKIDDDFIALKRSFEKEQKCDTYGIEKRFDFKSTRDLSNQGIRIITATDNPFVLTRIFESIDKNLAEQYINKNKIEFAR